MIKVDSKELFELFLRTAKEADAPTLLLYCEQDNVSGTFSFGEAKEPTYYEAKYAIVCSMFTVLFYCRIPIKQKAEHLVWAASLAAHKVGELSVKDGTLAVSNSGL